MLNKPRSTSKVIPSSTSSQPHLLESLRQKKKLLQEISDDPTLPSELKDPIFLCIKCISHTIKFLCVHEYIFSSEFENELKNTLKSIQKNDLFIESKKDQNLAYLVRLLELLDNIESLNPVFANRRVIKVTPPKVKFYKPLNFWYNLLKLIILTCIIWGSYSYLQFLTQKIDSLTNWKNVSFLQAVFFVVILIILIIFFGLGILKQINNHREMEIRLQKEQFFVDVFYSTLESTYLNENDRRKLLDNSFAQITKEREKPKSNFIENVKSLFNSK